MRLQNWTRPLLPMLLATLTSTPAEDQVSPDWKRLANPVYQVPGWSVKDATTTFHDGLFYVFFSAFIPVGERVASHVVCVTTPDWVAYSDPLFVWSGAEHGWLGVCSPEIHRFDGRFVLTYNRWGDKPGELNQLYYAESEDLKNWKKDLPLAHELTRDFRTIDAALARHNGRYYLFFKESKPHGDKPRVDLTRVASSDRLDGGWGFVFGGYPSFDLEGGRFSPLVHENYQPVLIDGVWHLLTTDYYPHEPWLYRIGGDPDDAGSWLVWQDGRRLEVPVEKGFNTAHRANAAHLVDLRARDGWFYLLYAGNTENKSFWTRGDNRLGLARSRDLVAWEVPDAPVRVSKP